MVESHAVETWLRNKLSTLRIGAVLSGLGLLVAAAVLLFFTFWFSYAIAFIGSLPFGLFSHQTNLLIAAIVIVLLFVCNATTDKRDLESYSFTTGTSNKKPVTIYIPTAGFGSTINPFAPDSAGSYVKMIANLVLFGPRLATWAWRFFQRAYRMSNIDIEGCSAVLTVLVESDARVPIRELAAAIPEGHDAALVLTEVREISGVFFVHVDPPALAMQSDLRAELRKLSHTKAKTKPATPDKQPPRKKRTDHP